MRTENINRKFKLHDERRIAAQLPEQLQGLDIVGFVRVEEFPGGLLNSFSEFASGAVAPHTRIYRNAQPNRIDAWLLDLLRQAGIGDLFYLRTGLEYFPWADCRVLDHRWLESLRRVVGPNQGFIAPDKSAAAMTIGAQYEVLGFARGAGVPLPPEAPAPAPPVDQPAAYTLAAISGATKTSSPAPSPAANLVQPSVPPTLTQPPAGNFSTPQASNQQSAPSAPTQPPAGSFSTSQPGNLVPSTTHPVLTQPPAGTLPPQAVTNLVQPLVVPSTTENSQPAATLTGPPAAMTAEPAAAPAHDMEATVLMSAIPAQSANAESTVLNTGMDAATQRITRDQSVASESEAPHNDPR